MRHSSGIVRTLSTCWRYGASRSIRCRGSFWISVAAPTPNFRSLIRGLPTTEELAMTKYVYDFTEGDKDQKDLLGGKGANLAEMTKLGLPVPPGFTITTEACREYLAL